MKAIRIHEFGGPEVMKLDEVPVPVPAADEILVKMYASSVNPADYIIRSGGNDLLRPFLTLPLGLGLDAAGIIVQLGSDVAGFTEGDRVYGVPNFPGDGSYAEYIAAKATQFAHIPDNWNFNEAGAVPSCALIAWDGIVEKGNVKPGDRVLIHGGAGGVGNLAVQFAKAFGAYVIATASPYNHAFLKDLGADEVLPYEGQDFRKLLDSIDLVFNASPVRDEHTREISADLVRNGGMFVCTQLDSPISESLKTRFTAKNAIATLVGGNGITYSSSLEGVTALANQGKVKAAIGKVFPLEKVEEAHRESETKHVSGKIVLEIRKDEDHK